MTLKRLALIGALSQLNSHGSHNSTTTTVTTTLSATMVSFTASSVYTENNDGGVAKGNSLQMGGLGLLHQQHLRNSATDGVGASRVGGINGSRTPVLGASGSGSANGGTNGSSANSQNINGNVNILLGGAMLSVVITVLCVVCYCCHRSIKKRTEAAYQQRWLDNDANMEIYSVEQCYETSGLFMESSEGLTVPALNHEPPPSYDTVVAMEEENQATRISPPPDYRSMNDISGPSHVNEIPKFIRTGQMFGMKKVLSAQSCCSLQRAEVENLFQLGIAAAAATSAGRFGLGTSARKSLPYTASRDETALGEGRFINSQLYYRGCPLCGKFRYDDAMSLSSDSGLDQVVIAVDVTNGNSLAVDVNKDTCYCVPTIEDRNNNVDEEHHTLASYEIENRCPHSSANESDVDDVNNNSNGDEYPSTHIDMATANNLSPSASALNAGACIPGTSSTIIADTDNTQVTSEPLNLDSINENGIIRLDMSKIIDKTGLPTYEAALKLESSGYV